MQPGKKIRKKGFIKAEGLRTMKNNGLSSNEGKLATLFLKILPEDSKTLSGE